MVKFTEEHKAKISAAHLGKKKPWVAARNQLQEIRDKVSAANTGHRHTEEVKAKISAAALADPNRGHAWIGRKHKEETKAAISAAKRGTIASEETRARLSEARRGNKNALGMRHTDETKAEMSAMRRGKRWTIETHEKMSRSRHTANFYVYLLLRDDGVTPFYVGMGRGDRWRNHEKASRRTKSYKNNIILQMVAKGQEIKHTKVAEGLSEHDAAELEKKLIASYGRHPNGQLVNLTEGGDGLIDPSPEVRAQIASKVSISLIGNQRRKGKPHDEATKARISATLIANNAIGKWNKGRVPSDETKEKISSALKGRAVSEETRARMRAARARQRAEQSAQNPMK